MNVMEILEKKSAIQFLEELTFPAYVVDKNRRILFWNKSAEELMGYKKKQVIGKKCAENVLNHVDRTGIPVCMTELCPLYRSMLTGQTCQVPFAVYGLTASGERIPVSVTGIPIKDEDGTTVGAIELFTDAQAQDSDLAMAIKIQQAFVPENNEHAEFFYRPSSGLGGDMIYFNYPWIGIIDISGHGIASALIGMLIRTTIDVIVSYDPPVSGFPYLLENELKKFDLNNNYLTTIFGKIEDDKFKFVNCGHPYPIDLTKKQPFVTENIPPIGMGFLEDYDESVANTFDLKSGSLLLYTDGITEQKVNSQLLGTDGLCGLVEEELSLEDIYLRTVKISKTLLQEDDITMIKILKK